MPAQRPSTREIAERLTRQLDQMMERLVLPHIPSLDQAFEISPAAGHALSILSRQAALPMSALAEAMGLPLSTTTHRIDKLVKKKLVGEWGQSTCVPIVEYRALRRVGGAVFRGW